MFLNIRNGGLEKYKNIFNCDQLKSKISIILNMKSNANSIKYFSHFDNLIKMRRGAKTKRFDLNVSIKQQRAIV